MKSETSIAIRMLIVLVIGAVGGVIAAAASRWIFDLPFDPATMLGIWKALIPSMLGGAIVLLISTTLMAQSSPQIRRGSVIVVLFFATAVLGAIAAAGLLLLVKFLGGDFFQGRTIREAALATAGSAVVAAILFLICVPIRGFDQPRVAAATAGAAPRAQAKPKSKATASSSGIGGLRRCPTCGTVVVKAYKAKDQAAAEKGQRLYVCSNGHEWHA